MDILIFGSESDNIKHVYLFFIIMFWSKFYFHFFFPTHKDITSDIFSDLNPEKKTDMKIFWG